MYAHVYSNHFDHICALGIEGGSVLRCHRFIEFNIGPVASSPLTQSLALPHVIFCIVFRSHKHSPFLSFLPIRFFLT